LDSDTLFTFQFHTVHFGTHTILATNIVNGMDAACIKQDAFRQCCLATIINCEYGTKNATVIVLHADSLTKRTYQCEH